MLLIDNINIIRDKWPQTWEKLKEIEATIDKALISLEQTKNGNKTILAKKGGKTIYFHSKYNPIREAQAIIDEYKDIHDNTNVIFYGVGLGYHIDVFLQKYPEVNYYIYEPIPEIIYTYLSNKSLDQLPIKNLRGIIIGTDKDEIYKFINKFIDKNRSNVLLVELPIHKQVFPTEYNEFIKLFKDAVNNKRVGLHTDYAFQKRWIINSMKNFGDVISTPNIIMENKGRFKEKPAILVAAGPSLNEEIENIRLIKNKGLAYIFSVGSAINTLIHNNIYPDAACTYDPTHLNQKVFAKVKELGITDIPLIFGSSVGYETIQNYPGKKYHMITSQDTVSNYYLKTADGDSISIVMDAPSIAVVTLQLLYILGFNPIILVGQNLAFRGKQRHSEGVFYSKEVTEDEIKNGVWVKGVDGNDVLTNEGFNRMREQMEFYIRELPGLKVINTTKGGAHIEGTTFMEMDKVIRELLTVKVVQKDWLSKNEVFYDKEYMQSQARKMEQAFNSLKQQMRKTYKILDAIEDMIRNRNFSRAEQTYSKLDRSFAKLERNDFMKTFILPMNRVNYKVLVDSIDSLNEEKNPIEKGKRIISSFRGFIEICIKDIEDLEPIYQEMKSKIFTYKGETSE